MKHLIIPDVHNRWETAESIIKHEAADKVVFLGDYFDDFYDDPHIIAEVADWFKHSVHQKNRIHIFGNHDVHYCFKNNKGMRCAGYDQFKSIAINDIVTEKEWNKLVYFYVLDNTWLLSHGGVHPSWINPKFKSEPLKITLKQLTNRLTTNSEVANREFHAGRGHWFGMPGFTRSQSPYYGGILWNDWDGEFQTIQGIHQIVGHTPQRSLSWIFQPEGEDIQKQAPLDKVVPKLSDKSSYNLCLDSHPGSRFYAIYQDGELTVKETANIK